MNDRDDDRNDMPAPVRAGLETWASRLDEQRYPGHAWLPATRPRARGLARRSPWLIATCTAAAAMTLAVTLRQSVGPSTQASRPEAARNQFRQRAGVESAEADALLPRVFVVEDTTSYSIIDATEEGAVVSFAMKDGVGPGWLVALPPSPSAVGR